LAKIIELHPPSRFSYEAFLELKRKVEQIKSEVETIINEINLGLCEIVKAEKEADLKFYDQLLEKSEALYRDVKYQGEQNELFQEIRSLITNTRKLIANYFASKGD
jgi:hypothetical protein